VRPDDLFALYWTLYRLQLSAAETTAALWWAVASSCANTATGAVFSPDGSGDQARHVPERRRELGMSPSAEDRGRALFI
jgi:hypothetical protein